MAIIINAPYNYTIAENDIEDRFLEYFNERGIDITDIQTAYGIKQVTYIAAFRYVYKCLFKPFKNQPDNRKSKIDYNDTDVLNTIADIYLDICFMYHIEPTYYSFTTLTGINYDTWYNWLNGEVRNNPTGNISHKWFLITQKVKQASQAYTRAELENGLVGQITKANNDREKGLLYSQTQAEITASVIAHETAEQIAARHVNATLPKKLNFDDDLTS